MCPWDSCAQEWGTNRNPLIFLISQVAQACARGDLWGKCRRNPWRGGMEAGAGISLLGGVPELLRLKAEASKHRQQVTDGRREA